MNISPDRSLATILTTNFFADVVLALGYIQSRRASGRLALRNGERFGVAHLYFKEARLVHVTGDKRASVEVLQDLLCWKKGSVRFDSAVICECDDVSWQQAEVFAHWLALLEMRAVVQGMPRHAVHRILMHLLIVLPRRPIDLPVHARERETERLRALPQLQDTSPTLPFLPLQQAFRRATEFAQETARLAVIRTEKLLQERFKDRPE
uniref:Uncharacterized protein n=1 Tax=Thermosporothrix sp. COM3 TaxID=2490863 RepID=A0A455SLL2_9CHLR|nr:hypothetical protein KTC_33570 [Thermosporothrix sp. COM3]